MARRNGSAPSFGPGHGHRCAERGAAPGCAATSEGSELNPGEAAPTRVGHDHRPSDPPSAIFLATTPNWWRNSAAFVVGAGAAITATVTIAFFASDGASNQQFFTDQVEWTTVETGEKIRGPDAVRDFIVALHMDPAHRLHRVGRSWSYTSPA